ncbi:biopolymer transporter ExbD [Pseudosulfitobacter sp. SM2401]|uniref:ExbD/TolR family protein n=1 Tax=Pseudosulfitobacter sp. SM2401 TaxID=3350098 RepID=UPI0036F35075
MRRDVLKKNREPTIALINVVFLMLVFFMVAGTLAAPIDPDLKLVKTQDLDGTEPADVLVIMADGTLMSQGAVVEDLAEFLDQFDRETGTARLMPDQDTAALRMIEVARKLRQNGAQRVVILTQKVAQ